MRRSTFLSLLLLTGFGAIVAPSPSLAAAASVAENCQRDIAYLPDFLIANDTGAADNRRVRGEAAIAAAQDKAMREASAATSEEACRVIIQAYLGAWRDGHLAVVPGDWSPAKEAAEAPSGDAPAPATPQARIAWLSDKTVLLTLPTFFASAAEGIVKMMADNGKRLERTPNWIIDVRDNNGGDDGTYAPITDAVIGNPIFIAGVEFLSTPANIEATAGLCDFYAPGDKNCIAALERLVTAMRAVPPGTYAPHPSLGDTVTRIDPDEPRRKRPARVAVLTDRECGSSCEQFLLAMKQAWNVKLFGRRTTGALDYSNLRPHKLPSGKRLILYATSRSKRLPHLPVDAVGVLPDVFLPPPADDAARTKEIDTVRALIEQR
ncbi:MAG: S41 family peptidase [Alphaproteobacteria bacterium]